MPFRPYDAGTHGIERARALLEASQVKELPASVRADLRRLSVVMAVSALDTYMHRLIVDNAFAHKQLPAGLARLEVPFERLLAQADATAAAARAKPHNSRPRVGVKRDLRNRLLFETFSKLPAGLGRAGYGRTAEEVERDRSGDDACTDSRRDQEAP